MNESTKIEAQIGAPTGGSDMAFPLCAGNLVVPGMTKRELFAVLLAAGRLAREDLSVKNATRDGVEAADRLIETLNGQRKDS